MKMTDNSVLYHVDGDASVRHPVSRLLHTSGIDPQHAYVIAGAKALIHAIERALGESAPPDRSGPSAAGEAL